MRLNVSSHRELHCPENDGQMAGTLEEYEKMSCNKIQLLQLSLPWGFQVQRHVTACMIINRSSDSMHVTDPGLYHPFKSPHLPVSQITALHV